MKNIIWIVIATASINCCFSQDKTRLIEDEFDQIAGDWLEKSGQLKTYNGVNEYCLNPEYRKSINKVLGQIHYYDSMILSKLNDPLSSSNSDTKETKKTLKHVAELEENYSVASFIEEMRNICGFRREIENASDKIKNSVAEESYSGKILILETQLRSYLVKIDRLVLHIDDHLHVLHIDN